MLFILHRYIFRELLKVFVPATVALTLILSLGSILRPVQEYGIGPRRVVDLMGYFLPIALTFVLPVAALFAAALVYGRFANDNELDACKASGISLMTLVYPGLALAVIVAIANLFLSFDVTPAFVHRAEKSLKADAKQILFRNIQRRGYYKVPDGRYLIYADYADSQNDTLLGVVVTEVKKGRIEKITTVNSAKVEFNPYERFNEVRITAYKPSQMGAEDEFWFDSEWLSFSVQFGSLLSDNIKFKKVDEMKRIQSDPMLFDPIARLARGTYAQLTAELLAEDIATKISNDTNNLYRLHSAEKLVEFTASRCVAGDERNVKLSGEVVVAEYDAASKERLCTLRPTDASLHIEGDELAPTLTMDIYNARVEGSGELRMRYIIRGLIPPRAVTDKFKSPNVFEDIHPKAVSSTLQNGPSLKLRDLQKGLQRQIQRTLAKIEAEIHSRLVFAIGCIPMILIGIGLGIIIRGGHLLSAFAASCVPATVLIVCIMSGKQIIKNLSSHAISGSVLMWAGVGFLTLLAIMIYRKLLSH
jgi:lipopolysaccharide export LptBFGC system permease protein LptF